MSKLEKFGLFSGILGVIVDSVAIIGYISGLLTFGIPNADFTDQNDAPVIFILLLAIVIIYSWLTISWTLTKRTVDHLEIKGTKYNLSKVVSRTVAGVGFLLLPLILGWFMATSIGTVGTNEVINRKKAIIFATQTAQVMEVPAYATRITKTQEAGGEVVIKESIAALEQEINDRGFPPNLGTYFISFPATSIMLGFLVFGIIDQLFPIIYSEILKEKDVFDEPSDDDDEDDEYE